MKIETYIDSLVSYAMNNGLADPLDHQVLTNRLLDLLRKDDYEPSTETQSEDLEEILAGILDYAVEKGLCDDGITAKDIFDGIAPVKLGGIMLHSGIWDSITFWKGVESCYIDLLDRPELIHAIMDRFTNAFIAQIEQINKLGLYDITSNIFHCSHTFSDRLPSADCNPDHPTTYDGWTFTMAQLFTSVSPAINEEFEVR